MAKKKSTQRSSGTDKTSSKKNHNHFSELTPTLEQIHEIDDIYTSYKQLALVDNFLFCLFIQYCLYFSFYSNSNADDNSQHLISEKIYDAFMTSLFNIFIYYFVDWLYPRGFFISSLKVFKNINEDIHEAYFSQSKALALSREHNELKKTSLLSNFMDNINFAAMLILNLQSTLFFMSRDLNINNSTKVASGLSQLFQIGLLFKSIFYNRSLKIIEKEKRRLIGISEALIVEYNDKKPNNNFHISYDESFNNHSYQHITPEKFLKLFYKTILSLYPRAHIIYTGESVHLIQWHIDDKKANAIKNKLVNDLTAENKKTEDKIILIKHLKKLIKASNNQLSWYYEFNESKNKDSLPYYSIYSTLLNSLSKNDQEIIHKLLQNIFGEDNVYHTPGQLNRFQINITSAHNSLDESKYELLNQTISSLTYQLPNTYLKEDITTKALEPVEPRTTPNIQDSPWIDFYAKKRYSSLLNVWRTTETVQANPFSSISQHKFQDFDPAYANVPDFKSEEESLNQLNQFKRVTLPLYYEKIHCGFFVVNGEDIKKLPSSGKSCIRLLNDSVTNKISHFKKITASNHYKTKLGADYKLRFFDPNGGDARGILIPIKPTSSSHHKKSLMKTEKLPTVYEFKITKHLSQGN